MKMLAKNGGKIKDRVSGTFLPLEESHLSGAAHMQLPADRWLGKFRMKSLATSAEIGAGAFGVVYGGTWRGTKVCLKQLHKHLNADEVAQAEFRLELKIMQQLHHRAHRGSSERRCPPRASHPSSANTWLVEA